MKYCVSYRASSEQVNTLTSGKRFTISLDDAAKTMNLEARTQGQLTTLKKRLRQSTIAVLYEGTMIARGEYQKSDVKTVSYTITEVHLP